MGSVAFRRAFNEPAVCVLPLTGEAQVWTNMPAAQTEFIGSAGKRRKVDLSSFREVCLSVTMGVAGASGAKVGLQYSIDGGTTWVYLDGSANGNLAAQTPQIAVDSTTPAIGSWTAIDAAGRTVVQLRVMGIGGDGAIDPNFQSFQALFR